jgi:malonyl CoA-acyl carrier protein transacylase
MRIGVVFAGQGAHKKGMACNLLESTTNPDIQRIQKSWNKAVNRLEEVFGFNITTIIRSNPDRTSYGIGDDTTVVTVKEGLMQRTPFTQPAMLLAEWALFEAACIQFPQLRTPAAFAGHSLGEFTALTAAGLFSIPDAVELVHYRGLCMEDSISLETKGPFKFTLFAVSPERAELRDDEFTLIVELIAKQLLMKNGFLEIVNYNYNRNQFVVAGNNFGLGALGKCLDPLFRGNAVTVGATTLEKLVDYAIADMEQDQVDGLNDGVNEPIPLPKIHGFHYKCERKNIFRQRDISSDGGHTLPEKYLEGLAYVGKGRSGLKKKSWFIPVPGVSVPFHSSMLRFGMDQFHDVLEQMLPSADLIQSKLEAPDGPKFICNLTGTTFSSAADAPFRQELARAITSANIGEQDHNGRYQSRVEPQIYAGVQSGDSRQLLLATLTAQFSRAVQWQTVMKEMVIRHQCDKVLEISPTPTVSEFFRRSNFVGGGGDAIPVEALCYPRDDGPVLKAMLNP